MDKQLYLEFIHYINTNSATPIFTPNTKKIQNSLKYNPAKTNKIFNSPSFNRPKSAQTGYCKSIRRAPKNLKVKITKIEELQPWSKSTSPKNSCRASGKLNLKEPETRPPTVFQNTDEKFSSLFIEPKPITQYETSISDYPQVLNYSTPTSNEKPVFSTEVPSFLHKVFPKSKIRKTLKKQAKVVNYSIDFPRSEIRSKSKLPSKLCYFNLKRRYYPVKFKSKFVPRFSTPFRPRSIMKNPKKNLDNFN